MRRPGLALGWEQKTRSRGPAQQHNRIGATTPLLIYIPLDLSDHIQTRDSFVHHIRLIFTAMCVGN